MPPGDFEKTVLRLLAANRNPESYVAGATVFLRREDSLRQSQDIDVFHDTVQSLKRAATQDAALLQANGYTLEWADHQEARQRATVSKAGRSPKVDWAYDSAFRFFPVQPDAELGFVLHPLDAATNKLLGLGFHSPIPDWPVPCPGCGQILPAASGCRFPPARRCHKTEAGRAFSTLIFGAHSAFAHRLLTR